MPRGSKTFWMFDKYLHLYFHCFNILYSWRHEFPTILDCCYFKIFQDVTLFYSLSKLISYFSIYDVEFYCLIVFTLFMFNQIMFTLKYFPFKKGHDRHKTKKFEWYVSHCDVILLLP